MLASSAAADDSANQYQDSLNFKSSPDHYTISVFGATGDLAKKKIYPALFDLYKKGLLPNKIHIIGYGRSKKTFDEIKAGFQPFIKFSEASDEEKFTTFCRFNSYASGAYDAPDGIKSLNDQMKKFESDSGSDSSHRLFYLALPPSVFKDVCKNIRENAWDCNGWRRLIVEKPFGKDLDSSNDLSKYLKSILKEEEIYRIDHYLGKEMVKNITALRFANLIFEASWSRKHIQSVTITMKENFGTQGRGGYFDEFGIIRDIIQNHLMQVVSLIAMEEPKSLGPEDLRNAKVEVLKTIPSVRIEETVIGQYVGDPNGKTEDARTGYLEDKTVPEGSTTPTYCQCIMWIKNERWKGVPFIVKAGKAMDVRKAEVRIQYKNLEKDIFPSGMNKRNELVIRVQPNEAVYLKLMMKNPGSYPITTVPTELDLTYFRRYKHVKLPEAYEILIVDALAGNQSSFVRSDELQEAWRIFTPLLKQLEKNNLKPVNYKFGTRGLPEADEQAKKAGFVYDSTYQWRPSLANM